MTDDSPNRTGRRIRLVGCLIVTVAAVLVVVGGVVAFRRYDPWALAMGSGLVLRHRPGAMAESRVRGTELVEALESFRAARGAYPATLDELAPQYLERTEPPLVGRGKWAYRRHDPNRFILELFVGPDYEMEWYDSDAGQWQVDY